MAPRKLRPVPTHEEDDLPPVEDDPADVLNQLADVVDRVDCLRETLPTSLRRAFDHVVVDLRHGSDAVREFYTAIGERP